MGLDYIPYARLTYRYALNCYLLTGYLLTYSRTY